MNKTLDILDDSIKQTYNIVDMGNASLNELYNQKQKIKSMTNDAEQIDSDMTPIGKIMNMIQIGQNKEKITCSLTIILLTIVIGILLYFRFNTI